MKITSNEQNINIRMTDEEAEVLARRLVVMVARRREMMARQPDFSYWNDQAMAVEGEVNNKTAMVSFSICKV
jgi:hypothetical protein